MIYKSAFILPINCKKRLTNFGWFFKSSEPLPPDLADVVVRGLNLQLEEECLESVSYRSEKYQVIVSYNDNKQVEYIHLKIYGQPLAPLLEELKTLNIGERAVIFVP